MYLHGLVDPDENSILSFDFWDTIVINLESPRARWMATMKELITEFGLKQELETYEIWYEKISKSIRRLNLENGRDAEFNSISAWSFLASLIFSQFSERKNFIERSQEIFFQNAVSGSKLNRFFSEFYKKSKNKENIIITSDYEIGRKFIYDLLFTKGIEFPLGNIFVSSDFLATKFSGNLFRQLINHFPDKKIVHIGDDFKSDFIMARKSGIETKYHARLDKAITRKFRFITSRYFALFRKLPFRIATFKNDIGLLRSSISQFKSMVETIIQPGDSVYFLGSEGAFFSNAFTNEFHLKYSSRCLNLGRKEILSELFPIDPDYVFTILLLEEFTTLEISKYMNSFSIITKKDLLNSLNTNFQKYKTSHNDIGIQKFLERIEPTSNPCGRVVTIDIGYKATFPTAFSRICDSRIIACQMLGFKQIQESSKLVVQTLQEVRVPKYGRPFSTKYLEILLGAGPRNEFSFHPLVVEVQQGILDQVAKKYFPVMKLVKFSRYPSRRIREALVRDRFDDLRMGTDKDESIDFA